MINLKNIINEMPISHHGNIGDFSKGSSFTNKADRALVTHPVAVQKIKDFFKNTSTDFDFYFVNTKEGRKYTEIGRVKEEFVFNDLKIKPDQLKNGRINGDAITVFFTNNKGDEKVPLTPWIIAHRFGHVIRRELTHEELAKFINNQIDEILKCYNYSKPAATNYYSNKNDFKSQRAYEIAKRHLCESIGTFKSARDKNLRNDAEFIHETFAQYLKSGAVTFNPLPEILLIGHGSFGRKLEKRLTDREIAEEYLGYLSRDYSYYAEEVLGSCIGNIYVM